MSLLQLLCSGPFNYDFFLCCPTALDKLVVPIDITCANSEPKHAQDADDSKEDALWEASDRFVESELNVYDDHEAEDHCKIYLSNSRVELYDEVQNWYHAEHQDGSHRNPEYFIRYNLTQTQCQVEEIYNSCEV